MPLTTCHPEQLSELLEGRMSVSNEQLLEQHLELCPRCRHRLELLAADQSWWTDSRELLVESPTAVDAKGSSVASSTGSELDLSQETASAQGLGPLPSLNFLSPSDNPAMLGRLGEFQILEYLGHGGMGVVLKGYDSELNRYVAVKVLRTHFAENGAARRRFIREAQAAAAVVHHHVVAIHAVDSSFQPPYFVMAFVPGETLQQRLDRDGPLPVPDVLRIGQQVAEGLHAAHARGLVHRDIKPSNILLERNVDRVLLADFGLARAADDASLTQSGIVAGTPQYMSPEQARGEAIDHRTDLFSLGSVLYTLLAGHPPFRAETTYGILRRVSDDTPRLLREWNPAVPVWLESLISRLMSKKPADRWNSAAEVAELLRLCLAHHQQPHLCPVPVVLQSPSRWRLRRSGRWGVVGIVSVVVCCALLVLVRPPRSETRPQVLMSPASQQANSLQQANQVKQASTVPMISARTASEPSPAKPRSEVSTPGGEQSRMPSQAIDSQGPAMVTGPQSSSAADRSPAAVQRSRNRSSQSQTAWQDSYDVERSSIGAQIKRLESEAESDF